MDVVEGMLKGAQEPAWLEQPVVGDLRAWQIMFITFASFLALIIALCCCIRFRVPRTKQQIEADYQRRIITKKFRQQLERIKNSQMDSIDLKSALDLIRAEFKTEENEKDQQQSVSLISSIVSPGQSSDEASLAEKCPEPPKQVEGVNLGKKLIALVRLSKQKPNEKENIVC